MFTLDISRNAQRQLFKIARKNPPIAKSIKEKILWLVANAESIEHEKMHGHDEHSLHSGQFRVLYVLNWKSKRIVIVDVDKHAAAYRSLKRR